MESSLSRRQQEKKVIMSIYIKFHKIIKRIKKFFYRISHFGIYVTFFDYFYEITKYPAISKVKHKAVAKWLQGKYQKFIFRHYEKANSLPQGNIPKQIWLCWWDGIDMMPPIVKACYNSVLHHSNDFQVTVVTKHNYTDYIFIPDHVINKVKNKRMTLTHFSNIIRMALLYKYGGFWLDATFLVTDKIKLDVIPFFTIRRGSNWKHIVNGRWTGHCIAGVPGFYFFNFIYEFLCEYWKEYNYLITYHLYDYSINLAYDSFPEIKAAFDNVKPSNINNTLINYFNNEYDSGVYEEVIKDTIFHKLTWKHNFSTTNFNNKITLYGYILDKYQ